MKSAILKTLCALLAVIMLIPCFISCGTSTKSTKIKVNVSVYNGEDIVDNIFLLAEGLELEAGSNALDAVTALCTLREATFTMAADGQFMNFTFDGTTIEGHDETLENGNIKMYMFGWKYNGTLMTSNAEGAVAVLPKDQVLNDGDSIVIFLQVEEVTPAKD